MLQVCAFILKIYARDMLRKILASFIAMSKMSKMTLGWSSLDATLQLGKEVNMNGYLDGELKYEGFYA